MASALEKGTLADISILIVAYRRPFNVEKILYSSKLAGFTKLYITLDAPKDASGKAFDDHGKTIEVVETFERQTGITVNKRYFESNHGCAVSLITGIDWVLSDSQKIIILEDDCLPTDNFFEFIVNKMPFLENSSDIWLICGTQFAPEQITRGSSPISRFALTWGWATTKERWKEIRPSFYDKPNHLNLRDIFALTPKQAFWTAGYRRAHQGFTDVWDTVLIQRMHQMRKFAILPSVSLVLNVGNDEVSTHVPGNSQWTNRIPVGSIENIHSDPAKNSRVDSWLENSFYGIRIRHVLTTKLTLLLDLFFSKRRRKFESSLSSRLAI